MAVRKKITNTVSSSKKSPAGLKSGSSFPDGDADALIRSAETPYRKKNALPNLLQSAIAPS
jgi:hypothetical protein